MYRGFCEACLPLGAAQLPTAPPAFMALSMSCCTPLGRDELKKATPLDTSGSSCPIQALLEAAGRSTACSCWHRCCREACGSRTDSGMVSRLASLPAVLTVAAACSENRQAEQGGPGLALRLVGPCEQLECLSRPFQGLREHVVLSHAARRGLLQQPAGRPAHLTLLNRTPRQSGPPANTSRINSTAQHVTHVACHAHLTSTQLLRQPHRHQCTAQTNQHC